jgi:beta-phosphoglucomutase-like phosphatase (HAD superfamily)
MIDAIDAILFEPVGALADFPGGSQRYWERVLALEFGGEPSSAAERKHIESSEIEAIEHAILYEDAAPALSELNALGVTLIAATSLSEVALTRFLERASLGHFFHNRWSRDAAEGVGHVVLTKAVAAASLAPGRVLFLADTEAGLRVAQQAGVHPILMMNDPDEAMRLTASKPAGGIVSLHELPDFVRFVSARSRAVGPGNFTPGEL